MYEFISETVTTAGGPLPLVFAQRPRGRVCRPRTPRGRERQHARGRASRRGRRVSVRVSGR